MNTAPWSIAEIEIIGGHCCPRPPAPFGRGPAVVRRLDDPDSIRIAFVLDSKGASGDSLTPPQWRSLLDSFNALALPEPTPARPHAALWVFTKSFGAALPGCVSDLRERKALIDTQRLLPTLQGAAAAPKTDDTPCLMLVDESRVRALRTAWRVQAHDSAWNSLKQGDLEQAQQHAERALSLLSNPVSDDFALLSIIDSYNGRLTRSKALLTAAQNSYGAEFCRQLDVDRQRMLADLKSLPPTAHKRESQIPSTSGQGRLRLLTLEAAEKNTKR